jgi:hypothetical protein
MTQQIDIDYETGTHGSFLEFTLNKLVAGDAIYQDHPFHIDGTSHSVHNSNYKSHQLFKSSHWFMNGGPASTKVISIKCNADDRLFAMTHQYLRASPPDKDDYYFHKNTFHKLHNTPYYSMIHYLRDCYSVDLSENQPHCPRNILRHYFQDIFIGYFLGRPNNHDRMVYRSDQQVYVFPFSSFYNLEQFKTHLENVKNFFGLEYSDFDVTQLHRVFLSNMFFTGYKKQCDDIVDAVIKNEFCLSANLSLFQESYINARLSIQSGVDIFLKDDQYPTDSIKLRLALDAYR